MSQSVPLSESDRIALIQMFKAIAEYGRKVRQRREGEMAKHEPTQQAEPTQGSENPGAVRQSTL